MAIKAIKKEKIVKSGEGKSNLKVRESKKWRKLKKLGGKSIWKKSKKKFRKIHRKKFQIPKQEKLTNPKSFRRPNRLHNAIPTNPHHIIENFINPIDLFAKCWKIRRHLRTMPVNLSWKKGTYHWLHVIFVTCFISSEAENPFLLWNCHTHIFMKEKGFIFW